jgi:hydroxyethylthiazole kinase-like uncharacterized protein yjeF
VRLLADWRPDGVPPELVCAEDVATGIADERIAALLIGPGLGRGQTARARLGAVVSRGLPTVIDADALMLLGPDLPLRAACVLTPHEGEMAALERAFGLSGAALRRDRAGALARASGAVVLLKGPDSLIAAPDGSITLAPRASSWLAVAGSGDVLAGMIASRLALHGDAVRAAQEGLWLHGEAARLAGPAFTALDLARATRLAVRAAIA